ncbi:MAG TPA: hypothetical protein VHS09_10725 [Polyangiaceae bacterium]|nr:hypothetical protein [Polyangiaceae bacterium]
MTRALRLLALGGATMTCVPALGPGDSLVSSPRILAVRADPPEAGPGASVTFTAFVAGPDGTVADAAIAWSFCSAPKPLTEDNVVSSACLDASSLVAAGAGPTTTAATPGNGCSVFGPDVGMTAGLRPRDPDGTGGYYQPLRADLAGSDSAFELARIHCDLANADAMAAAAFAAAYTLNQNPQLLPLTASVGGAPVPLTGIPTGARVTFEASWPDASAETFAYYDPGSETVTTQRESMQVAWYSSAGVLDRESTGRAADDSATTTDDGWDAPAAAGTVHLWLVLRDSRGGVDFAPYDLVVGP